jgi:hypothetical protein
MGLREDLRSLAGKLEDLRTDLYTDLHNYSRTLEGLAEDVKRVEDENTRLKAGK